MHILRNAIDSPYRGSGDSRLDAVHVKSESAQEAACVDIYSEVELRGAAIFHIICRSSLRSCGAVLHLPDGSCGETEVLAEAGVELCDRSTAERAERSTGVEGEDVRHIGGHRMPGLAYLETLAGLFLLPAKCYVGLAETELCGSG